jgi:hypothetical protein
MSQTEVSEAIRWPAGSVARDEAAAGVLPRWTRKHLTCGALLAALFLGLHLPVLAPAPDDVDAANFALALRDFNPEQHQPHPPGYPLFVGLGRVARALLASLPAGWYAEPAQLESRALALCSAVLGALAVFPLLQLFAGLERNWRRAWAATAIAVTSPLFWFTSARPLSDIPGLTVSLAVQALAVAVIARLYPSSGTPTAGPLAVRDVEVCDRLLILAALIGGAGIGMRSQTLWITLPPLVLALWYRARRGPARIVGRSALAFACGVAVWAVPLVIASGGAGNYVRILLDQGGEDFIGVDMLLFDPTPRKVARALFHTLVLPWADVRLAAVVLGAATIGGVALLRQSRMALLVLATAAVPYGLFHLMFHETDHTRYALPIVPVVAYLAASGFAVVAGRALLAPTLAVAGLSVYLAAAPLSAYAAAGSPVFRAANDVRAAAAGLPEPPVLAMHNAVWLAMRGETLHGRVLTAKHGYEWLELAKYWRQGGSAPIWFLARSRRTDLALIDPASRRLVERYAWPFRTEALLGGARPGRIDWHEIREPGWFAEAGWSLTPEVHGVTYRDGRGLAHGPIVAFVRRRQDAATLMVGGQTEEGARVRFEVTLDGTTIASWTAEPASAFLEMSRVPAKVFAGQDRYARLEVTATAESGAELADALVDQFDVQSERPIIGFSDGWYALEAEARTGVLWRWASDTAKVRIENFDEDLTLRLRGDSPLEHFPLPPEVSVRAGRRVLHAFSPTPGFDLAIPLSAETIREAGGMLTIETDRSFVPRDVVGGGDRRRLAVRFFEVQVEVAERP